MREQSPLLSSVLYRLVRPSCDEIRHGKIDLVSLQQTIVLHVVHSYHLSVSTSRHVASLLAGLMLMRPVVVGNVGDNNVSSYRLHASKTEQLSYVPMADATRFVICVESTNDGPTCNTP